MYIKRENIKMLGKLGVIVLAMFGFGYALVPIYKAICEMTGINVLALGDRQIPGATPNISTIPWRNSGCWRWAGARIMALEALACRP